MPAFSTHYIFACEMMDFLKKSTDFKVNENAVLIGAQGPDVFFYHRALPWQKGKTLRRVGSALHRSMPGEILDRLYEYSESSDEKSTAKSYACGFILHYALDRKCHPLVYYFQNELTSKNVLMNPHSAHNTVELALDSLMLSKHMNIQRPRLFRTDEVFRFTESEKRECARELAYISGVKPKQAETAFEDMKHAQTLLLDESGAKVKIIFLLESLAAPFTKNFRLSSFFRTDDLEKCEKYVNINNGKWQSPFQSGVRTDSFFDLYELAKSEAAEMIIKWNSGCPGGEITENISFLTGVELV